MSAVAPYIERLADWPDLVALHAHAPDRYPFLLESTAHQGAPGRATARWDVLFAFPGERLWLDAGNGLRRSGTPGGSGTLWERPSGRDSDGGFLAALDRWWHHDRLPDTTDPRLPFRGGWFLYCGYELAGEIEPTLDLPAAPDDPLPVAAAVRVPAAVLRDHASGDAWLVDEAGPGERVDTLRADLRAAAEVAVQRGPLTGGPPREDAPARYIEMVERARRHIHDGDVFQANLSRGWRARLRAGAGPLDCYRRLRTHNAAPFAGYMRWSDAVTVASSSPERLVRTAGTLVETRPIAGTRPRGAGGGSDARLSSELLAHPKERAEHVMLIDLERNDIGRVAEYGSVEVDEMMVLESYATVHHIVSNVRGRLRPGTTPGAVIRAVFPGGTITGCPKVRCMEIIAELERTPRGAYTGSFGWLGHDGDMDLNILIRTLTVRGDEVDLRAGAGIVADSVPERELDETRQKAAGLLRALAADA